MGVAKVAIIGRPNVGKSSIFNWLVGERVSIVDSVAGVTRDRVSFLLDIGLDGVDEKYIVPELAVDDEDDQYVSDETYDSPEPGDAESELSDDNLLDFEDEDVPFEPIVNEEQKNGDFEEEEANEFEDEIVEAEEISLEEEPETPKISARYIELIDSGGIGIVDKDDLSADVEQQIQAAIDMADLILFVVDARDGLAPLDEYVAERLRKLQVPIILVANKCDGETQEYDSREFHCFGWGVVSVSAKQKRGRVALMDAIEKALP
ncbi:MAG: 50S ribosome-binding GTPase, partial [Thermoguttaceae bacterium]|nr:50S ribosome-binding GTPase [Thermoguttaceae bacterium]